MNFCGGEIDQQIVPDDYSSTALLSNSHMCGACVKSDMEDEDGHVVELITVLTDSREASEAGPEISRDDNVTSSCYTTNLSKTEVRLSSNRLELDSAVISKSAGAMPRKISQRPRSHAKTALDSIVETITSDEGDNLAKSSLDLSSFHRGNPNQSRSTSSCGRLQTPSSSGSVLLTTSPSPVLLNPLTHSNWESKPNLLCPVLERRNKPSPVEQLIVRLEDGFRVRFVGGPGSKNWKGHHLHFYLHHDRTRICVQSNPDADEKKDDASEFGFDLYVHRILKLEVNDGRPGRPRRSFTLVVNDNAVTTPVNYDFEARSTLEREVIVSTVLVLLDQSHHSKLPIRVDTDIPGSTQSRDLHNLSNETTIPIEEGTSDLPIPCSPSLGDDAASTETIISPRRHTRIYNDEEGTETSLIIHLEDIESRDPIDADDENELHARALVETSSQLSAMNFTSAHLISGNWCSDDVCTLALRDIADTCTGIFALKQEEPFTSCYNLVANDQALMVQEYFRSALGAPNAVYSYILESDVWSADRSVPQHGNEPSRPIKNRANVLNAQAIRLRKLRNEMTFAAALKQSEEKMHFVQTTQSFDDARHYSSKPPLKVANQAAQRLHSSPLLQHVIQSMKVSDGHTVESTENVDFYDSDPEDVKPRTLTSRGPRQAAADRLNVVEKNNIKNNDKAMSANFLEQIPFDKKVKKLDEDAVVDVVQGMINERLILIWHPTQTKTNQNRSPICVRVWIESGVYLVDGTFLLPKLTWSRAAEDKDYASKGKHRQPITALEKFDLLEICRICPVTHIDRNRHPFASTSKCFYIETGSDSYMFEAQNSEERDRIVYGLKLVVARLASLLMLRDIRAADEFFGAANSSVPGEAPQWARGEENHTGATSVEH